eukprot:6701367-Alexandrium_andersonii.AAC.1
MFMKFEDVLAEAGLFLTTEQHASATNFLWRAMNDYMALAQHYAERGLHVSNVVNKHHMMIHVAQQARWINPHQPS